jgi:hypothetical protein
MNILKRTFNFYINASIHVALAVCALVFITAMEFGFECSNYLVGFLFFGTISGYNFVKYAKVAGLHHRSLTDSLKVIQVFSFVSLGGLIFCALQLSITVFYMGAIFGGLTFLYAVPFLHKRNLRTFSGLKIFVVALVWAGVTVFIPWSNTPEVLTFDLWLTFFQRILVVIVCTLPFEIRDLPYDASSLKTLPQVFGIKKAKFLGTSLLVDASLLEVFNENPSLTYGISLWVACVLTFFLLLKATKNQHRYFASFWVESVPLIWCGLFYLVELYLPLNIY